MEELNILADKEIDPDQLDVEWLTQSSLYYKYSDALNDQSDIKNELKILVEEQEKEIESKKAQLELDIRDNPKAFDLEKITDASVKAAVIIQPEYKKAMKKLFRLKRELNAAQGQVNRMFTNVNTILEKKISLSNLGGLLNQQYFSTPSIPRNLSIEYSKRIETNQRKAKEKIKRRIRGVRHE